MSVIYRRVRPTANNTVAVSIETAAAFIAFTITAAPLTYLCARSDHELMDWSLRRADAALGFDWALWNSFIQRLPVAGLILKAAYASIAIQPVIAAFFLPTIGNGSRGFQLIWQGIVSMGMTCLFFWLFPAMGATNADWTSDIKLLRGPSPLDIDIRDLKGIISFPSFHAVLGVLFIYACRGTRMLAPAMVLNAIMIVSAVSVGKHYLVDIIAGLGVAFASITVVERIGRSSDELTIATERRNYGDSLLIQVPRSDSFDRAIPQPAKAGPRSPCA